jgi:hypothetical protein
MAPAKRSKRLTPRDVKKIFATQKYFTNWLIRGKNDDCVGQCGMFKAENSGKFLYSL